MPKNLKEISKFHRGTIINVSERDITDDTAAFSLNIDPMAEDGLLDSIKNDRIAFSTDERIGRLIYPVTWERTNQAVSADTYNKSTVLINDISILGESDDILNCDFIGTKGRKETVRVNGIHPWWERLEATTALDATFTTATAITITQDTIPFLTDTNAITSVGLATGDITFSGFTNGTATITLLDATRTNYDDADASDYFTITSPDGRVINYHFSDAHNESQTGTAVTINSIAGVAIGMSDGTASVDAIAENVKDAIAHANGHGGRISVSRTDGVLTLTYVHPTLNSILGPGDYITFNTSTFTATAQEIIRIESVDTVGNKFYVKRSLFGSVPSIYAVSTVFEIWANRLTIDSRQIGTTRGVITLGNWSGYSGNDIGGSGNWIHKASGPDASNTKEQLGVIALGSDSVYFTNSAKTIGFDNVPVPLAFNEGDTVTIYEAASQPNHGKSFKILKKEQAPISGNLTHRWTVDTAPTDDEADSGTMYLESSLLLNPTFHHQLSEINPIVEVGNTHTYKVNKWKGMRDVWTYGGNSTYTVTNVLTTMGSNDYIQRVSPGGYWEGNNGEDHGADNAENYYPFVANDAYLSMEAFYHRTGQATNTICYIGDAFVNGGDKKVFSVNDIIYIGTEYMRITSMTENKLYVDRGILGSTEAEHAAAANIFKNVKPQIQQDVSSTKLKAGQPYILTFHAKDLFTSSKYGYGAVSVEFNGGYINSGGEWIRASKDNNLGYSSLVQNVQQEARWIDFQDLAKVNGDVAYNADGTEAITGLDTTWRRFELLIYPPKGVDFATDMTISFTSRGKHESQIGLDLVDLSELTLITPNVNESFVTSIGSINNAGKKDLVMYDSKRKNLQVVKDFNENDTQTLPVISEIEQSPYASPIINSESQSATFVSKNRETHIGFGSKSGDSAPQWLGYLNNKLFGTDSSNELYQDEDTVHSYDTTGLVAMSKITLAGEHENLESYWNLSGTFNDGQATSLVATKLRIYHTNHNAETGNNIIVREWQDVDNSWDGNGVWVIVDGGTSTSYFDCQRITAKDANPVEEGCFSIASTSTSGGTVTINCGEDHGLIVGDKVVIANTTTFNGTKTVAAITDADTFTFTETLANNNETGKAAKQFRLCYRPYYYYGIRDGDSFLYRIIPEDIYTDASTVSPDYTKGKIEKSLRLSFPASSITTCYNKESDGTGGGNVYILTPGGEIRVVNIELKYTEWGKLPLAVTATLTPDYKAYKWSNDSLSGDINGDTAVYGSLAEESTPTITPAGMISDILETKGPTRAFVHKATANTENTSAMFDTRLWIQFRPASGETFTSGDRFLFCGLTESGNTDESQTLFVGDRTPPTGVTFPKRYRWDLGNMFHCGPGIATNQGSMDSGASLGDFPRQHLQAHSLWHSSRHGGSHSSGYQKERVAKFAVVTGTGGQAGNGWYNEVNLQRYSSNVNFGNNVSWDGDGGHLASIYVARYGLFAIADNDGDGILDGTGLVVPSSTTLIQDDGDTIRNQNLGPWGYEHEKVCSHAVGLIGGSDRPWVRDFGKMVANPPSFTSNHAYYKGAVGGAPENMSVEKCIFICSDVHYGDKPFNFDSGQIYWATKATHFTTVDWAGLGGGTATKIRIEDTTGIQPGDIVYIDDSAASDDYNRSAVVLKIDDVEYFTVNMPYVSTSQAYIYPHTVEKYVPGGTKTAHPYAVHKQHYHFAYSDADPLDAEIFTNEPERPGGHYSKTWWTPPSSRGLDSTGAAPGMLHRVERLNYRAGYMMRPFDLDDNTFQDLIIGHGLYVDAPSRPDNVYHVNNDVATPNYLHWHVNDDVVNNQFASKIFISAPMADTYDETGKSKIYICDPSFQYPDILHQIEKVMNPGGPNSTNSWNGSWKQYEPTLYGKLGSSPYVSVSATTKDIHKNATNCPVVVLDPATTLMVDGHGLLGASNIWRNRNRFAGMMLTIIDQTTGTMQTRYIVGSDVQGLLATDDLYLGVHYPFGHAPIANDLYFIWEHHYACTSSVRLFREKELDLSFTLDGVNTVALKADPIIGAPIYKTNGAIASTSGSGGVLTVTTSVNHNLSTNDVVRISETDSYNDIFTITNTGPKTFTFAHTSTANETGTWELAELGGDDSSVINPIKYGLDSPLIKTAFGGFDMRKLRSLVTTDLDAQGSAVAAEIAIHSTAHFLQTGDTITFNGNTAAHDGVYTVIDKTTDDFDVLNPSTANDTTDAQPITTNQWESLVVSTEGTGKMAETRAGFNAWDTGQAISNFLRNDNATQTNDNLLLATTDASVEVNTSSIGDQTNDFFLKNTEYEYKVSLMYDGYQEGILSTSTWSHKDTIKTRARLSISISIKKFSKRLTNICLYRRDSKDDFYRLVEQIPTSGGWTYDGSVYTRTIDDSGAVEASYDARTGKSEVLDSIKLKYGLSVEIDGYLFAGDCSHENIENASNQVFRSKPGMYSVFDYASDFLQLKSKPTALANFAGRLYAFDKNNIYKINQQSMAIEDIFEGIGCSSKDSLIVTEYGMFFADNNGAYMHNGTTPNKISSSIEKGGGTDKTWAGTDNIKDISWHSVAGNALSKPPFVTFDSNISSVLFIASYNDYNTDTTLSIEKHYAWSYNLIKTRWDLWELATDSLIGAPFLGDKGAIFIPVNNLVYEYRGGSGKRDYTWLSKKLTMEEDSILKVYSKVKLNGLTDNLILGGDNKESSDRLLIKTSGGDIASSDIIFSTASGNHSEYILKSSNKKGRWLQLKLEDMTTPIESIGIIYRRKSTK